MIKRSQSTRVTKCRGCNGNIPAHTPCYFVASVGNNSTNVFICLDCVYALILDVASDYDKFDDLGEMLVMRKINT